MVCRPGEGPGGCAQTGPAAGLAGFSFSLEILVGACMCVCVHPCVFVFTCQLGSLVPTWPPSQPSVWVSGWGSGKDSVYRPFAL